MRISCWHPILGLSFGLMFLAHGQEAQPPVPVLERGKAPHGAEGRYVFLDPTTGDAVVFYGPGGKPAGANPFESSTVRVDIKLSRHVLPSISTKVARNVNTGEIRYHYIFSNATEARETAWKWLIEGVDQADTMSVQTPPGWMYQFPVVRAGGISISEKFRKADPHLRSLQFLATDSRKALKPDAGVSPGGSVAGFELTSRRLPGIVGVFVQGGFYVPSFAEEPPAAVSQEIDTLIRSDYNYRRTFAIGPRFPPNYSPTAITKEYLKDLARLEQAEAPDISAKFVAEARVLLQSGRFDAEFSSATSPLERDIVNAFRIALQATSGRSGPAR